MPQMKLKKLEEYLQGVEGFERPKLEFEQYVTPSHIASCMLYEIQAKFEDIENKLVCDLGSGCGMLSIGSFLLGANLTIGFEVDSDAIDIFRTNVTEMEIPTVDCIQTNVLEHIEYSPFENKFDTVVSNPPFGTKNNAGMDMKFLQTACKLSCNAVYSLHKTSTRDFIQKKTKEWGTNGEVVAKLRYNLDSSYKFHKHKSVDIEVAFGELLLKEKIFEFL
uniref:Methyltransferase-like protein 5 n=1 Tax=Megaselia scalaris TaxID=36166 RepID=T1GLX7_MEGSC